MGGQKSGGGARTPYEAPNKLSSAQMLRIVDVISEGVVAGFANGNDAPFKSVFFNDTPVQNPDGSYNFKGVTAVFQRGTPDQSYIPGWESVERTVSVSKPTTSLPTSRPASIGISGCDWWTAPGWPENGRHRWTGYAATTPACCSSS